MIRQSEDHPAQFLFIRQPGQQPLVAFNLVEATMVVSPPCRFWTPWPGPEHFDHTPRSIAIARVKQWSVRGHIFSWI
jgi:hypothetical protein